MAVGNLIRQHLGQIFFYCDTQEHEEINALLDRQYSKKTFGISFPFCREVNEIEPSQSKRYWTEVYLVRGKRVRVTSQWYDVHGPLFIAYLESKGIATVCGFEEYESPQSHDGASAALTSRVARRANPSITPENQPSSRSNSRYRGSAIGNSQNLFIRNILSSIGRESFSEKDWISTREHFSHRCAYCGEETKLQIEHAIPINRERLGEHRLGNLVPSCKQCNDKKSDRDFREFLGEDVAAVTRIEEYMDSRNYVPLEDNEQMKMILDMAYREVGALADRYITIINELFTQDPHRLD